MSKRSAIIVFSAAMSAMSLVRAMTKAEYDEFIVNEEIAELCDESPQAKNAMPPLSMDAIVGTWEGTFDIDCYHYGWALSRVVSTYKFNNDGTFSFEFPFDYQFKQQVWRKERGHIRAAGTWKYDDGHLVLDGTIMRQYYEPSLNVPSVTTRLNLVVLWFGDNEIAIVPETASAFGLYSADYGADFQRKSVGDIGVSTGFDRDGFLVVMREKQVREYTYVHCTVTSPSHYKRIGKRYFGKVAVSPKQKDGDIIESHPIEYVVKPGDHLASIARRLNVPIQELRAANGNSDVIRAGQKLSIVRGGGDQAPFNPEDQRQQSPVDANTPRTKNESEQARPPYRIIDLARDKDCDFAYTFTLELSGDASIQTFFGVQAVFANEIRMAYQMEYPSADASALRVVVQPSLSNGKIVGRAEVLTITPTSLTYDANTCRGKLSVRFNANQYEAARAWVRRNIETLARDKNIALVTGEIPPNARFYSLGESLKDGNVLEIEFKTE